mgnify:FL=1
MSLGGGTVDNDINNAISAIESHNEPVKIDEVLMERQQAMLQEQKEIEELFQKNPLQKIKVMNINFKEDAISFNSDILYKYAEQTLGKVQTMEDFQIQSMILQEKLIGNGLIQELNIGNVAARLVDLGKVNQMPFTFSKNKVVIIEPELSFVPLKKFAAKTGSKVGNGEGDGYIQLQLRNFLKNGENLVVDVEKGTKTKSNVMVQLSRPLNIWNKVSLTFLQNKRAWGDFLMYDMNNAKLEWSYNFKFLPTSLSSLESLKRSPWNFNLSFDYAKIGLHQQNNNVFKLPFSIIKEFKPYDRLQLQLNLVKDNRDSKVTPHVGTLLKSTIQANYIPSSQKYWESVQFEYQNAQSVPVSDRLLTFISSFKIGSILQYNDERDLPILEKFQKGGPNDVRLFNTMGLGPKTEEIMNKNNVKNKGVSLGGTGHVSYGVSALYPFKKDSSFNWLVFLNGGHLTNDVRNLFNTGHTLSCGMGISFVHPVARFELNFGVPLMSYDSDYSRGKVQYGLGMSFL